MPSPADHPDLLYAGLLGWHQLRRCLYGLSGLPCFILRHHHASGLIDWWELLSDDRKLRPFDFEFRVGRPELRDAYHQRNLAEARRTGRPVSARLFGFHDLYVPLLTTSEARASLTFYVGQFTFEVPSYEAIAHAWKEVSGRQAAPTDPLFQRWLATCLEVPVLCRDQLHGLTQLGRQIARLARGVSPSRVQRRIEHLRRQLFAPHAVDHNWVLSAIDEEGLTRPPWGLDPELDPRLSEELGLTRRPSAIAVLALDRRKLRSSAIEQQVFTRQLQQRAAHFCRQLESSLAGPLPGGGVIVALSVPAITRGKQRQGRITSAVQKLQRLLTRQAQLPTVAGVGLEVVPGAGLGRSYHQAQAALAIAIEQRQPVVVYQQSTHTFTTRPEVAAPSLPMPAQSSAQRIHFALSWLERHLDSKAPLDEVARRSGFAPASFRRAFKAARGQSFGRWLRDVRIDAVVTLLTQEDLPLSAVAERVGFAGVHALISNFRQRLGTTPGAYRRQMMSEMHPKAK